MILKKQRSGRGTLRVTRQHAQHLTLEQMRALTHAHGDAVWLLDADRQRLAMP